MSSHLPAYALIIAIDGYGLTAPEADARRLRNALIALGVRDRSIELLTGAAATRSNIIKCLNGIAAGRGVIKDAPILIYFAGHGLTRRYPIPGLGERQVEFIVPYDALTNHAHPIPDMTISALLGKIAKSQGNHITLILDCCHSGSGSRAGNPNETTPQLPVDQLNFDSDALEREDGELWSEFLSNPSSVVTNENARAASTNRYSFRYQGVTSHVLIASCRENERSMEQPIHPGQPPSGIFTHFLIQALGDCREDNMVWNLTYSGLFKRINDNMKGGGFPQNPQLEGYHRDRCIFSTSASPHQHHAITSIEYQPPGPNTRTGGYYVLPVGSLAGVYDQALFDIYDYNDGKRSLIKRLQASTVEGNRTIIGVKRDLVLSPDAYAVLCTPPTALPVRIAPDFASSWNRPDFQAALRASLGGQYNLTDYITPVQSGAQAKLQISTSPAHGIQLQTEFGSLINMPGSNRWVNPLSRALTKAVVFYHHLDRVNIHSNASSDLFQVQVLELSEALTSLEGEGRSDPARVLVPRQDRRPINLQPRSETRIVATHSPQAEFGLKIHNTTTNKYFVYVFYFDPNDFSITSIYMPSSSETKPPLRAGGDLTIGYGDQGAASLQFTIDDHLVKDPGFFKLYFSLSPVEMGTIQQDGFDPRETPRPNQNYNHSPPPFGSVVYPITVLNPRFMR